MIKKYIKNGFGISIIFITLLLSVIYLTSCGKEDKEGSNDETPEYVYEAKFKEIGTVDLNLLSQACITDEGIYMLARYYEFDEDNNIETEISYFMRYPASGDKIDITEIKDLKKNEYIQKFLLDKNGSMVVLTSVNHYNENTGEVKSDYYMINVDRHGRFSKRTRLMPDLDKNEQLDIGAGSAAYIEDKLLIDSENKIYTFNKDGSAGKSIELEDYIDYMFTASNNKVYIMSYIDGKNGIRELDMETGKLGEALGYAGNEIYNIDHAKQLDNGNVYLSNSDGVFECDFKTNKVEFLFDWVNVDINNYSIVDFQPMEDGSIDVICSESDITEAGNSQISFDIDVAAINKKKYSDVKPKKRLKFAAYYMDETIKGELLKFNRTNEDYRIEVINYGAYDDPQKQMNLDITSGNIPDIMELSYMPKEIYIKRGILADLYFIMEKDGKLKKEDFVDSVRATLEYDGKLYYMPIAFAVNIMLGSKSTFGDMEGWSLEEMQEKYNNTPEDGMFMSYVTSEGFIRNMLGMQADNFINYETGEVNLDSEEFINILEFSKNFKTNDEYYNSEESMEDIDTDELTRNNKLLLREMYLCDFAQLKSNEELYKNQGGYAVLSYPSADKSNKLSMSGVTGCLAISEKCDDKAGAWEFIKTLYEVEFQTSVTNNHNGFPVIKAALDKKMEAAMQAKTNSGVSGTNGKPAVTDSYLFDGYTEDIGPYTKEQMDIFSSIVDRIGLSSDDNIVFNDITGMIEEETKAFYIGDKTAKETAEILQSRVKIYISENS